MGSWTSAIERLGAAATVTTELTGPDVLAASADRFDELLETYPRLPKFKEYLEFLGSTGGADINGEQFSLMLYGLGGYVVPSFDEGQFLDRDRWFLIGEVLYPIADQGDKTVFFACDTGDESDRVVLP